MTLRRCKFVVSGPPIPKRITTYRAKWVDPRAVKSRQYQEFVAWAAKFAGCPVFGATPVALTVMVHLLMSKSRWRRNRGDLKNYVAAIEDGLVYGGYLDDDTWVWRYGEGTGLYFDAESPTEECVEVEITEMRDSAPTPSRVV